MRKPKSCTFSLDEEVIKRLQARRNATGQPMGRQVEEALLKHWGCDENALK